MQNGINFIISKKLEEAREQTDHLLGMVRPEAFYDRPIAERHRLVFYAGHLEAFDWNMICRRELGLESFHPEFDQLFEFGIDPGPDELPTDQASDWPSLAHIDQYRVRTREAVDRALENADDPWAFSLALEHRLMHAETLTYLLHRLPPAKKVRKVDALDYKREPAPRSVEIPEGDATLGRRRHSNEQFGWDNEFSEEPVHTPAFSIDVHNVTNRQFLEFVVAGGYEDRSLWTGQAWDWVQKNGIRHPNFWRNDNGEWMYETMFSTIPLPLSWLSTLAMLRLRHTPGGEAGFCRPRRNIIGRLSERSKVPSGISPGAIPRLPPKCTGISTPSVGTPSLWVRTVPATVLSVSRISCRMGGSGLRPFSRLYGASCRSGCIRDILRISSTEIITC